MPAALADSNLRGLTGIRAACSATAGSLALPLMMGWIILVMAPTTVFSQFESWQPTSDHRRKLGKLQTSWIQESSGLAASLHHPHCFWTHNDNGQNPGLFLLHQDGTLQARVKCPSIPFRDWEDLASVSRQGKHFLVLADVGDNQSRYPTCRIYILEEPRFDLSQPNPGLQERTTSPVAIVEFAYPDGPRDCEAILVDVQDEKIFTISKNMDADAEENLSVIHWIPFQLTSTERPLQARKLESAFNKHMITGANISGQGNLAVIRSYTTAWVLARPPEKTWLDTLESTEPLARILLPLQRQGEAVCFAEDGQSLILTSEGGFQVIWQVDLPKSVQRRP